MSEQEELRAALVELIEAHAEANSHKSVDPWNAKGHSHEHPYKWDGTESPCRWCLAWKRAHAAIGRPIADPLASHPELPLS